MATVYGLYVTNTSGSSTRSWRSFLTYTISSTDTTYTLTVNSCGVDLSGGSSTTMEATAGKVQYSLSATNKSTEAKSSGFPSSNVSVHADVDWKILTNRQFVWNKTHSPQNVSSSWYVHFSNVWSGGSTATTGTITIPAKTSYAVTYDANGGTGTVADDTKWHDETLTLSDGTGLTRDHYTLKGWNTASDGTGTHYDLGAEYTGNEAVALHAEWELNAVLGDAKVSGEWKQGMLYAKVDGEWVIPHTGFVKVNNEWIEITT